MGDPVAGYRDGNLKFVLKGQKLHGKWALIKMKGKGEKQAPWLLIKEKDGCARSADEYDVLAALPDSVGAAMPVAPDGSGIRAAGDRTSRGARQVLDKAAMPAGAVACLLPAMLTPQLATLVDRAPLDDNQWRYEIKFDGYRLLARVDGDKVTLFTRNGHDWSAKMPDQVAALRSMKLQSAWLDGEIVVPDAAGLPSFQALQAAFDASASRDIVYYVFDLPFYAGHDLRQVPLHARQRLLGEVLHGRTSDRVRLSETFDVPPGPLLASACRMGLEGVIGKKLSSTYAGRRSADWIKIKCKNRQEFVVVGYTPGAGSRAEFGALLLGVNDDTGKLRFVGKVGTGFDQHSLQQIGAALARLPSVDAPFNNVAGIDRTATWVEPTLVAEVRFAAWTANGRLRHAVFHALRNDKPAKTIVREKIVPMPSGAGTALPPAPSTIRISHPDKVIDASTGITKRDLVHYYARVGLLMMPHLAAAAG